MAERFLGKKEVGSPILPPGSENINIDKSIMAQSKFSENLVRLKCTVCGRTNYYVRKNKKKVERKLEFKKYCSWCRKRTSHKELKLK